MTPRQYAEMNGVAYTTVMYWLNKGKVDGAIKHTTPFGHYWELPDDTPRPKKMSGRPKKLKDGAVTLPFAPTTTTAKPKAGTKTAGVKKSAKRKGGATK